MSRWTDLMFKRPSVELQQYVEVPIFNESIKCFDPPPESMKLAFELFVPQNNHIIKCISRTVDPQKFPSHSLPEVAFLGQSNAGKSSLLNAVFEQVPDLHIQTSRKPGHTKCLSFYQVGKHFCLVDMPGYGLRQPKWFQSSVITYLKSRKNLVKTFMLIDCKEGYNSWDDAALQMIKEIKIPFAVILTKIDTVPDSQRLKIFLQVQKLVVAKERSCFPEIFMLSSTTYEGLAYFIAFVAHITGNVGVKNC